MPYKVVGRIQWRGKRLPIGTVIEDGAFPKGKLRQFVFARRLVPVLTTNPGDGPSVAEVVNLTEKSAQELIEGLRDGSLSPDAVEVVELARGDKKVRTTVLAAIEEAREGDVEASAEAEAEASVA